MQILLNHQKVKFTFKGGGYILFYWKQLFIYYLLRWCVQCTHYTPVAEEQTEASFPSYKIFTKHKSIVQWTEGAKY